MSEEYEYFDDIPDDAFEPGGVCSFCKEKGPVIKLMFGSVLVDEETGEIADPDDVGMEVFRRVDSTDLCKKCARFVSEQPQMPLEHLEAEYRKSNT